jgi:hypothetical protein
VAGLLLDGVEIGAEEVDGADGTEGVGAPGRVGPDVTEGVGAPGTVGPGGPAGGRGNCGPPIDIDIDSSIIDRASMISSSLVHFEQRERHGKP